MSAASIANRTTADADHRTGRASRLSRFFQHYGWPVLFVGPAVFGFLAFKLIPILASFGVALTDWRVSRAPNWVGLANFQALFADALFYKSLFVTVLYTLVSVPVSMAAALGLALLINQRIPAVGFFRTVFYLPSIMPVVATSILWLWMFNPDLGLLNAGLRFFGLPRSQWIYGEMSVLPSLVLMSLWGVGPMMIIFLAGLQGVPRDLYEAVEIDGGRSWHKFRDVTIPMLTPTILFNLVIGTVNALQSFVQAAIMTEGGPNNGSLFLVYYIYRTAFQFSNMGYASALSWVLFVITTGIGFFILLTSARWVFYYGQRA
jgi:multiple sugar transport system permease protein